MALDQATLAESHRITTALNASTYYKGEDSISSLYTRPVTNGVLNREEYLTKAIALVREYFTICDVKLPETIHVSVSAPSAKRKADKTDENNTRLVGNLVQVWLNSKNQYEIYIANQLEKTSEILACLCGALVLTHVGLVPTVKFPEGELTFKSEQYDLAAKKIGIDGKFRGNLAKVTTTLSELLVRVRDAIGPCPIVHIDTVVQRSGLKQESKSIKVMCKNEKCSCLELKNEQGKAFPYSFNVGTYFTSQMSEAQLNALKCPFCSGKMELVDTKAEKAAKKAVAESNVITLSTPTSTEAPAQEQTPSEAPQAPVTAKPEKVNRKGRNAA